jgi:hypothetical protein
MFDRGDSSLESLIEDTAALNVSPLSDIQGCCLLYQTFKTAVSSIKHSRLLSPLSNIQDCCLLYQTFKAAVCHLYQTFKAAVCLLYQTFKAVVSSGGSRLECLIEEPAAMNV